MVGGGCCFVASLEVLGAGWGWYNMSFWGFGCLYCLVLWLCCCIGGFVCWF